MSELDGVWKVDRLSGALPPLAGVRKHIHGAAGETRIGPLPGVPFTVEGRSLRYHRPFSFCVDVLEPAGDGYVGKTVVAGRELGRFKLRRIESA